MAEILGITAASLQLTEIVTKLLFRANSLRSKLHHLPETLCQTAESIKRLANTLETFRVGIERTTTVPGILSTRSIDQASTLLSSCEREILALERILKHVQPDPTDKKLQAAVRRVGSLFKEEDLKRHQNGLARLQNDLQLWCTQQNLLLAWQQIDQFVTFGDQLNSGASRMQVELSNLASQTSTRLSSLDASLQSTRQLSDGKVADLKSRMLMGFSEVDSQLQESHTATVNHTDMLHQVQTSVADIEKSARLPVNLSKDSIDSLANEIMVQISSKPTLMSDIAQSSLLTPTYMNRKCRCRQMRSRFDVFGLQYRSVSSQSPGCPIHGPAYQRTSTVRATVLCKYVSRGIELVFSYSYGAGGASISPQILPIRIVNDHQEPAFVYIRQARVALQSLIGQSDFEGEIARPFLRHVTQDTVSAAIELLAQLRVQLVQIFQQGKATGRDQNIYGRTLLHVMLGAPIHRADQSLKVSLLTRIKVLVALTVTDCGGQEFSSLLTAVWSFQDQAAENIRLIMDLLMANGAQINSKGKPYGHLQDHMGWGVFYTTDQTTPLSVVTRYGRFRDESSRILPLGTRLVIPEIFASFGDELQDVGFFDGNAWLSTFSLIKNCPDLALDFGCSMLTSAIVGRDLVALESLICDGCEINERMHGVFTPLCFAVGWNAGMRMLLEAGGDPSSAIHVAVSIRSEEAVNMLLTYGSCLSSLPGRPLPGFWNEYEGENVLQWAFAHACGSMNPCTYRIVDLIIRHSAKLRKQLIMLAKKHPQTLRADLNTRVKSLGANLLTDSEAANIFECLAEHQNIHVPEILWPGDKHSIYHHEYITLEAAKLFTSLGFVEFDDADLEGVTPMLVAVHSSYCWGADENSAYLNLVRLISWFVHRGARCSWDHLHGHILHLMSAHMSWALLDIYGDFTVTSILEKQVANVTADIIETGTDTGRIPAQATQVPDDCSCHCSAAGCLPIHTLLKPQANLVPERAHPLWADRQTLLEAWKTSWGGNNFTHTEYSEICRLELFERLGMGHTCCKWKLVTLPFAVHHMSDEEAEEIRLEDDYTGAQLSQLVESFNSFQQIYDHLPSELWTIWWRTVGDYIRPTRWVLPDESGNLEETQMLPRVERGDAYIDKNPRLNRKAAKVKDLSGQNETLAEQSPAQGTESFRIDERNPQRDLFDGMDWSKDEDLWDGYEELGQYGRNRFVFPRLASPDNSMSEEKFLRVLGKIRWRVTEDMRQLERGNTPEEHGQ